MNNIEQKDIDLQDRIDNYLRNEMNPNEKNGFESEIAKDSTLKQKVETQKLISEEIKNRAAFNLIVNGVIKKDKKRIQFKRAMAISWSAVAIFIGVFFVNSAVQNSRMDNLYTENYTTPQVDIMRGDGMRGIDPNETDFMQAINYLENKQPEQAHEILLKIYKIDDRFTYYEDVRWYLALTELKLHNKSEARKYLNELVESEFYGEKAKKVLAKLKLFTLRLRNSKL